MRRTEIKYRGVDDGTLRNFIGMELDPQYFEIAKKRIEEAERIGVQCEI